MNEALLASKIQPYCMRWTDVCVSVRCIGTSFRSSHDLLASFSEHRSFCSISTQIISIITFHLPYFTQSGNLSAFSYRASPRDLCLALCHPRTHLSPSIIQTGNLSALSYRDSRWNLCSTPNAYECIVVSSSDTCDLVWALRSDDEVGRGACGTGDVVYSQLDLRGWVVLWLQ